MRRLFVPVGTLLALALVGPTVAVAQDATPPASQSPLAAMGYPELHVTLSAAGLEVTPQEVPAGLTLITVEITGAEDANSVILVQLADDVTLNDLEPSAATPTAGGYPAWFYQATIIGPGGSLTDFQSVANLSPGDWAVLPYSDVTVRAPAPFTVTGEAATPPAGQLPPVDVTATEFDFGFTLSATTAPAGVQVWEVANVGAQPHEMAIFRFPQPVTPEQFVEQYRAAQTVPEDSATPPPQPYFNWEEIEFLAGVPALSFGQRVWSAFDLPPGDYLAICFLDDPYTGMSHIEMGMIQPFTVGEAGTPEA